MDALVYVSVCVWKCEKGLVFYFKFHYQLFLFCWLFTVASIIKQQMVTTIVHFFPNFFLFLYFWISKMTLWSVEIFSWLHCAGYIILIIAIIKSMCFFSFHFISFYILWSTFHTIYITYIARLRVLKFVSSHIYMNSRIHVQVNYMFDFHNIYP